MLPSVSDVRIAELDRGEMLRLLGHRGQDLDRELAGRVDAAAARCLSLARPRMAVRSFSVSSRAFGADGVPELHLDGAALVLSGTDISRHLAQAQRVGVLAVTLGMGVERELQRLSLAGDALGQLLFDAAASAAIECVADAAEAALVDEAMAQGMGTTWRFSPGYGDLPLSCQSALLASIDATRRLGITLSAGNLLVPTKSVTAVVGMGVDVDRLQRPSCANCNLRNYCSIRADGRACRGSARKEMP